MRRPSLKIRITAWFALMMFVIEALVLSFLLCKAATASWKSRFVSWRTPTSSAWCVRTA